MFKHALTQDVAYGSLLVQRRRELHGLVGLAIEELYADRLPEHYEMLAHHFSRAEDWERALEYLLKAAEKATKAFGLRQALELYGDALEVARRLGDRVPAATLTAIHRARADLFFGRGRIWSVARAAEALVDLARRVEDRPAEADALIQVASAFSGWRTFRQRSSGRGKRSRSPRALGAPGPLGGALFVRGYVHPVSGRLDAAEEITPRARNRAGARRSVAQGLALHTLALRRGWQGEYQESLKLQPRGRLARERRLVVPLIRGLWNRGVALTDLGDYDRALAALNEGLALAEKIGDDASSRASSTRSDGSASSAETSPAASSCPSVRTKSPVDLPAQGTGPAPSGRLHPQQRGGGLHGAGRAERRRRSAGGKPPHRPASAAIALDDVALHHPVLRGSRPARAPAGRSEWARRLADQSLEIAVPTRSRKFESAAWRIKGESATLRGAWDEAEDALRRAVSIAEAIGQPRQTWLSHVALGRLDAANGRRDDALRRYRAAWTIITGLRARTQEPTLRAGLESPPLVREVEDLARPE